MLTFDANNKVLDCFKIPHRDRDYVYKKDDMKVAYEKYLNSEDGLLKDMQLLVDGLNSVVSQNADVVNPLRLVRMEKVLNEGYLDIQSPGIDVYLTLAIASRELPKFRLMTLPYMHDDSILERRNEKYALIRELVQDYEITITQDNNRNSLKVITDAGNYVNLFNTPEKPQTKFGKEKLNIVDVIYGLAKVEGLNCATIRNKLVSPAINAMFSNTKTSESVAIAHGYNKAAAYIDKIQTEDYRISNVREALNETLSIDRAKGKILSRTLKVGNSSYSPGTVVTNSILKLMKFYGMNELFVQALPVYNGWYIAETLALKFIKKGSKLPEEIISQGIVPCDASGYVTDNYQFYCSEEEQLYPGFTHVLCKWYPTVFTNIEITEDLLKFLLYNQVRTIKLKESQTSSANTFKDVALEVSIVGNRHFRSKDLKDCNLDCEWVYLKEVKGEDGNYSIQYVPAQDTLCAYDYIALLSLYDRIYLDEDIDMLASNDLGFRKRVLQTDKIFSKAFRMVNNKFFKKYARGFRNLYNDIQGNVATADDIAAKFIGYENEWWGYIYTDMKLVTRVDRTNPIAMYSSLQKVKAIFADKNGIPESARLMTMGHYGRLCPYETPSGKQLGITQNKAILCDIKDGVMRTPYYPVRQNKQTGESYIIRNKKAIQYLTVKEEEEYKIADITDLDFDLNTGKIFTKSRVLARVPNRGSAEKVTVAYVDVGDINFVNVDPNQTDSVAATTIPFQGADDSARVVFETSMCKQAKGLLAPEIPLVSTSAFTDVPRLSTYYMIHAEYDGVVLEAREYRVVVQYDGFKEPTVYDYNTTEFCSDALIVRVLEVREDQRIKAGDILVSSNFVKEGNMVTGINGLIAYVPKGSNYEDGIFAAERISMKLMSYGTKTHKENYSKLNPKLIIKSVPFHKYVLPNQKFMYVRKSIRVAKKKDSGKDSNGYVNNKRFVNNSMPIESDSKTKGFIVKCYHKMDPSTQKEEALVINLLSIDPLDEGDKLANRHGNKGVTPTIRSNDQLLQFNNGEFVDIVYNPAGVSSRMNIGQILECNLGLVCYILGIRARSDSFNGASTAEIKLLLEYVWDLANRDDWQSVFTEQKYVSIPLALHNYCKNNIKRIQAWRGSFNADGTAYLYNPKTGRMLEQPALVGINYIYKLIHESSKKMQARAGFCTEPYIERTSAPTEGISKHGGQRYAYMELDALASYGCAEFMYELQNHRGDNPILRNNLTVDALHKGDAYKINESYAIRRSTEEFIADLLALGVVVDFEGELPNLTRESARERNVYRIETLAKAVSDKDAVIADSKPAAEVASQINIDDEESW